MSGEGGAVKTIQVMEIIAALRRLLVGVRGVVDAKGTLVASKKEISRCIKALECVEKILLREAEKADDIVRDRHEDRG